MNDNCAAVFVYGTLRPGQPNYSVAARGVTSSVTGHGHGLRLYVASHHNYPYATDGRPDDVAVGSLLALHPDHASDTLHRLDWLEGFDPDHPDRSHYLRRQQAFVTDGPSWAGPTGTTITAWVYLAGPRTSLRALQPIASGDWIHPAGRSRRTCSCVASSV